MFEFINENPEGTFQTATEGSAGFDLCYYGEHEVLSFDPEGEVLVVPTGVRVNMPVGWCGMLFIRSSLAAKGISLANGVGLIDSDYTGEIKVLLTSTKNFYINKGQRIAQLVFTPYHPGPVYQVDEFPETERGEGGFGSTGDV